MIEIVMGSPKPRGIKPALGEICVTLNGEFHFPMKGWEDFSIAILVMWERECRSRSQQKLFYFMDDQFRIEHTGKQIKFFFGDELVKSVDLDFDAFRQAVCGAIDILMQSTQEGFDNDRDLQQLRSRLNGSE